MTHILDKTPEARIPDIETQLGIIFKWLEGLDDRLEALDKKVKEVEPKKYTTSEIVALSEAISGSREGLVVSPS